MKIKSIPALLGKQFVFVLYEIPLAIREHTWFVPGVLYLISAFSSEFWENLYPLRWIDRGGTYCVDLALV
jgi:hypothetical protein